MRSSKSRSRSKQNRPRSIGNIINRVFDSSGPEGKVRGTPQQIIEKYQTLARDAQLSNDRVAAENFLQHAEHYTRMLGEAQREMAAEQEARRQQQGGQPGNGQGHGQGDRAWPPRVQDRSDEDQPDLGGMVPVLPFDDPAVDSGLVDTPETRSEPARPQAQPRRDDRRAEQPSHRDAQAPRREDRRRDDRKPAPASEAATDAAAESVPKAAPQPAPHGAAAQEGDAAPADAQKPARRPRGPRKPKPESGGTPPSEAAE